MVLTLKDKTTIDVLDTSIATYLALTVADEAALGKVRMALTNANLSSFTFGDGERVYGDYANFALVSISYTVKEDGKLAVKITLRQKSDIEIRLEAIEAEHATQNDAIADMSEVIYSE